MKKPYVSLALALAFTLSLLPAAALAAPAEEAPPLPAYESFTDRDQVEYTQAVFSLASLGVAEAQEDGAFHPDGQITRGELVKMIVLILNGGEDLPPDETLAAPFSDTAGTWCAPYVAWCAQRGIVSGRGDGTFGPDDPVTGYETGKMLLCALGYDAEAEGLTGRMWSLQTAMLAVTAGLFNGVREVGNQPLSRQGACLLLTNALQLQEVTYEEGAAVPGSLMLTNRFGYSLVTGVVAEAGETLTLKDVTVNGAAAASADGVYSATLAEERLLSDQVKFFAKFADPEAPAPEGAEILPGSLVAVNESGSELFLPVIG